MLSSWERDLMMNSDCCISTDLPPPGTQVKTLKHLNFCPESRCHLLYSSLSHFDLYGQRENNLDSFLWKNQFHGDLSYKIGLTVRPQQQAENQPTGGCLCTAVLRRGFQTTPRIPILSLSNHLSLFSFSSVMLTEPWRGTVPRANGRLTSGSPGPGMLLTDEFHHRHVP